MFLMNLKFSRNRNRQGFTLIELLAYITLFVVIFGIIITFVSWSYRANTKFQAMREVLMNIQRVSERILSEVREADSVYTPTTDLNQLSLETFRYAPGGETTSFIDIFICQARLCLKKESDILPVAITSDKVIVQTLEFTIVPGLDGPDAVQFTIQIDYNGHGGIEEEASAEVTSTAILRNY